MSNPSSNLTENDTLADFSVRQICLEGITKNVFVAGSGPAVIVMAEMPGISPHVARFSRWVRDAGFTVYLPSLFGQDGVLTNAEQGLAVLQRACISAEFRSFVSATHSSAVSAIAPGSITHWLCALARQVHAECGGAGVGTIGMCFTGNFALMMMLEPAVLAPVLCQPSLPFDDAASTGLSPTDLQQISTRLQKENRKVLALRFAGDKHCKAERFAAFEQALGENFVPQVLPDSAANPEPPPFFKHIVGCPHSVVTAHLIDEEGQATIAARDAILRFLKTVLAV